MAKIFYSVAGEGRGHATRVHAMVQMLRKQHDIVLFTSGDSYEFLEPIYQHSEVRLQRIPGLVFQYSPDRKVDYLRTSHFTCQFIMGLPWLLNDIAQVIEEEGPDLVITDFEPAVPRAAWRFDIPVVSLDHQHFLVTSDFSELPRYLQNQALFMGWCVDAYYTTQVETIVSSFFAPPLKPECENTTQIGVLLREEFFQTRAQEGDYLLVYWRKLSDPQVLEALKTTGHEVRIYGLGELPDDGNLRFFPVQAQQFLDELAGCKALISTAGNQLIGEALHFRKPCFVIPEANNYEQYINAFYLNKSGMGTWSELPQLNGALISAFLERLDDYRALIDPEQAIGNQRALAAISRHLPAPVPQAARAESGGPGGTAVSWLHSVIRARRGRPDQPRFLTYLVTFRCNARCVMCDCWRKTHTDELSPPAIEGIFRQLPRQDAVRLSGGEPFLRRDLREIADLAAALLRPLYLHITSNGFLTEQIVRFCETRTRALPLMLLISLDGVGEKHDAVRGSAGAWEKAMRTLHALAARQHGTQPAPGGEPDHRRCRRLRAISRAARGAGPARHSPPRGDRLRSERNLQHRGDDRTGAARRRRLPFLRHAAPRTVAGAVRGFRRRRAPLCPAGAPGQTLLLSRHTQPPVSSPRRAQSPLRGIEFPPAPVPQRRCAGLPIQLGTPG